MNSGALAASPGAAVRGRPPGGTHPLIQKDHKPRAPAGALRRQMSANQGQDPWESTSRFDFRRHPNIHIARRNPNVNSP